MTDQIFLRDNFIFNPTRGTFDFVFRAQAILQSATASAMYRDVQGQAHSITLANHRLAHQIDGAHFVARFGDDNVELVWNVLIGAEPIAWLEIVNRSRAPIQIDELHVLALDATSGAQVSLGRTVIVAIFRERLAIVVGGVRARLR